MGTSVCNLGGWRRGCRHTQRTWRRLDWSGSGNLSLQRSCRMTRCWQDYCKISASDRSEATERWPPCLCLAPHPEAAEYHLYGYNSGSTILFLGILISQDKSPGCTEYSRKLYSSETAIRMVFHSVVHKPSSSEPPRTLLPKTWFPDQLRQHQLEVG